MTGVATVSIPLLTIPYKIRKSWFQCWIQSAWLINNQK